MISVVSTEPAIRLYVRFGTVFVAWKMLAKNVGPRIAPGYRDAQQTGDAAEQRPARDAVGRDRLVDGVRYLRVVGGCRAALRRCGDESDASVDWV